MKVTPDDCIAKLAEGEQLSEAVRAVLDPPSIGSIHFFHMKFGGATELHYHEYDEYWLFTEGRTKLTLRTPEGVKREFDAGPYTLIATPKGVEHGHLPETDVKGVEWIGPLAPGVRMAHLIREL